MLAKGRERRVAAPFLFRYLRVPIPAETCVLFSGAKTEKSRHRCRDFSV